MSVKAPIPLIQHINKEIQGVESAPENYPRKIDSLDMPIALCFPGEGVSSGHRRLMVQERQYMIDVYVDSVTQGIYDDPLQETMDLIDRFVNTWTDLANDEEDWTLDYGTDSGFRIDLDRNKPITDSGWRMDLQWAPEVYYFGFRLTIPIMVRWGTGLLR
jgi:hypothetical protein